MDNEQNSRISYSNIHELEKKHHNPEELYYLFIKLLRRQHAISTLDHQLLDRLIDNEFLPEECAQQLLCIKVLFLMKNMKTDAKSADIALALLDKLKDPDYRLTCFSRTYFELASLKADILFFQKKYLEAYEYLNGVYNSEIVDSAFNELEKADELKNQFKIKMAIATHFAEIEGDLSYKLFVEVFFDKKNPQHLSHSNCNAFVTFGYECFRQKKYNEALQVFEHGFKLIKESEHIIPCLKSKKELEQELIAIRLITKKMAGMGISHEEILGFCNAFTEIDGMSDKNKHLRTQVIELLAASVILGHSTAMQQPIMPMYTLFREEQSKEQCETNKNLKKQNSKNVSPKYG